MVEIHPLSAFGPCRRQLADSGIGALPRDLGRLFLESLIRSPYGEISRQTRVLPARLPPRFKVRIQTSGMYERPMDGADVGILVRCL